MITKKDAIEIAVNYLKERNRSYIYIERNEEKIRFKESETISYGKYEDQQLDLYVVNYDIEAYQDPIPHFIYISAKDGEVLFTVSPHGYVEEWED